MGNNALGLVGVNWTALVMALKFLDSSGSGSNLAAASAVRYAADHGARVSNNSYAGGGGTTLSNAISYAATKGSIFVAAAGNAGREHRHHANYPSAYPLDNIIAVAAVDSDGSLAGFSNYGAQTVDVGAPGVGILSTVPNGGYGYMERHVDGRPARDRDGRAAAGPAPGLDLQPDHPADPDHDDAPRVAGGQDRHRRHSSTPRPSSRRRPSATGRHGSSSATTSTPRRRGRRGGRSGAAGPGTTGSSASRPCSRATRRRRWSPTRRTRATSRSRPGCGSTAGPGGDDVAGGRQPGAGRRRGGVQPGLPRRRGAVPRRPRGVGQLLPVRLERGRLVSLQAAVVRRRALRQGLGRRGGRAVGLDVRAGRLGRPDRPARRGSTAAPGAPPPPSTTSS